MFQMSPLAGELSNAFMWRLSHDGCKGIRTGLLDYTEHAWIEVAPIPYNLVIRGP